MGRAHRLLPTSEGEVLDLTADRYEFLGSFVAWLRPWRFSHLGWCGDRVGVIK